MKKRLLSLISMLMIVLVFMTGCGTKADTSVTNNNGAEQNEDAKKNDAEKAQQTDLVLEGLEVYEEETYDSKDEVAMYVSLFGHLPSNYITKEEAKKLGWQGGSLDSIAPGKCIGGSYFGNYEGLLPEAEGREYTECDIDTIGADSRGAKRIVFSNDGLVYYTENHYESFELLYGEE